MRSSRGAPILSQDATTAATGADQDAGRARSGFYSRSHRGGVPLPNGFTRADSPGLVESDSTEGVKQKPCTFNLCPRVHGCASLCDFCSMRWQRSNLFLPGWGVVCSCRSEANVQYSVKCNRFFLCCVLFVQLG